ncbi:hypothetical protein V1504DRAFT_436424 [Lipomyces starkeyi]
MESMEKSFSHPNDSKSTKSRGSSPTSPGPLHRGISRGLLWEENGKPTFGTVQQMERWLNVRLPDVESKLALEKYPLVLCHLDLAPRNIIKLEDGSVCLLDWASAGFYPRFFEVCLLKIMEYSHGKYELDLIDRMEKQGFSNVTFGALFREWYQLFLPLNSHGSGVGCRK